MRRVAPLRRKSALRRSSPFRGRRRRPAKTQAEKAHHAAVAALGCIICGAPANVHHTKFNTGAGQRSGHFSVIPLCPMHHQTGGFGIAFHAGSRTWQDKFGTEESLLAKVRRKLGWDDQSLALREACEACGDYICNLHGDHTGECYCDCPGVEEFDLCGINPYALGSLAEARELNRLAHEDDDDE